MLKAIHAQEDREAAREKAKLVAENSLHRLLKVAFIFCMETISQPARSIHRPQKQLRVVKLKERSGIFLRAA